MSEKERSFESPLSGKAGELLNNLPDPVNDQIGHRDGLVRLGSLAAVGAAGAAIALGVAGRWGLEKWQHNRDQSRIFNSILLANRLLLARGGSEGRRIFIEENLEEVLFGDALDPTWKSRFISAMTIDAPVDIYFNRGGLGVWQYNGDGAITQKLIQIKEESSPELGNLLEQAISRIEASTKKALGK